MKKLTRSILLFCAAIRVVDAVDYEAESLKVIGSKYGAAIGAADGKPIFDITRYAEGSSMEAARLIAQQKLPVGSDIMNERVKSYEL